MGRLVRLALVACGLLAAGGTMAWATGLAGLGFVGSDGTIVACVQNTNGDVRFIDSSSTNRDLSSCRANESRVKFNQQGPQGPPGSSAAPYSATVNCPAQSINDALQQAGDATSVNLTINGTCVETVQINRDQVQLVAGPGGGGIEAGSGFCGQAVCVNQSRNIELSGLTLSNGGVASYASTIGLDNVHITGAPTAVQAGSSSTVSINNVTIDSCQQGIDAEFASTVSTFATTMTGCQTAVRAGQGASVALRNVSVTNTAFQAVVAEQGGSIRIDNSTVDGAGNLTVLAFGGSIDVGGSNALVTGSTFCGVAASDGGEVSVHSGARITANGGGGMCADNGGSLLLQDGGIVDSNGGPGIHVSAGGTLRMRNHSVVSDNTGPGIQVSDTSVVEFDHNDDNQITGNGDSGIACDGPPSTGLYRGEPGTVSGNGGPDQITCPHSGG